MCVTVYDIVTLRLQVSHKDFGIKIIGQKFFFIFNWLAQILFGGKNL
jgi:hypothetical protein